jgi:hypothetical protein
MHNDVHKVTARNKWRCREKEMFVYKNMLSVYIISRSISQVVIPYFRRITWYRLCGTCIMMYTK